MAVAHQKSVVTNDAVTNLAEPRQEDKEALLEERGNRVFEIGSLGEVPQLLNNLRRIGSRHEEIGNEAEALAYVPMKGTERSQSDHRKPVGITLAILRGFDNL